MLKDMIEIARVVAESGKGTTKKLAANLVSFFERPQPCKVWAPTTDAGSVHLPREANRFYKPEEARALAVAILKAADRAESYTPVRVPRIDKVLR